MDILKYYRNYTYLQIFWNFQLEGLSLTTSLIFMNIKKEVINIKLNIWINKKQVLNNKILFTLP